MDLRFLPGYYTWTLYDGDEYLYQWEDFVEDLPEVVNEEAACDEADLMMYVVRKVYEEDMEENYRLRELVENDKLFVAATQLIADTILYYYGDI